ncbi:RmlC-like cupin domain-containing protein [Xylaria venustula]|nr:RmlC-like cupin domain-containing protein [Xylaria venustula]
MEEENVFESMRMPRRPVNVVPAKEGEVLQLGPVKCRIMEDGSRTVHDETFLVTKGTVRFHLPDGKYVDAKEGDYVVVPTRAPHTFSNPTGEESIFFNTFTPAYYINYFKLMSEMTEGGARPLTHDVIREAMSKYATVPATEMGQ